MNRNCFSVFQRYRSMGILMTVNCIKSHMNWTEYSQSRIKFASSFLSKLSQIIVVLVIPRYLEEKNWFPLGWVNAEWDSPNNELTRIEIPWNLLLFLIKKAKRTFQKISLERVTKKMLDPSIFPSSRNPFCIYLIFNWSIIAEIFLKG